MLVWDSVSLAIRFKQVFKAEEEADEDNGAHSSRMFPGLHRPRKKLHQHDKTI